MQLDLVLRVIGIVGALFFIGPGAWAFLDPQGFYDELAPFEPYNEHFIHDLGAFQLGIGVTLAAAVWRAGDALLAAFIGAAIGSASHTAAHFLDHDLGGKDSDLYVFGLVTAVLAAAAFLRLRQGGARLPAR